MTLKDVEDKIFAFHDKPNPRIYQLDPVRVYLVHNIDGKWLFWGRIFIQSLEITLKGGKWMTGGKYNVVDVYDPYNQEVFTRREAPPGSNYFCP